MLEKGALDTKSNPVHQPIFCSDLGRWRLPS
jgi:hypothetical protein